MVSLAELKKKSKNSLETLKKQATKETTGNRSSKDERFWTIERNKDGNAYAIIRFLPVPQVDSDSEDALCWAKIYTHAFKSPKTGQWYIETSLTTIGKQDAIGDYNRELWNSGIEANKKIVSAQKRKLQYISNIYVVKDPNNPENEGKVFLYKYGKKIFDKIMGCIQPPEGFDEVSTDPFDFWEGRDFKLKVRTVDDYPNFDTSEFSPVAPIADKNGNALDDSEIERIFAKEYSLLEFTNPDNKDMFKSPEELQKRLNKVLGLNPSEAKMEDKSSSSKKTETKKEPEVEKSTAREEAEVEDVDDDIDIDDILKDM